MLGQAPRVSGAAAGLAVACAAGLVAFLAASNLTAAIALAVLPFLALLAARPALTSIIAVGLLPFATDVVRGGPVRVSVSDALLLLAVLTTVLGAHRFQWRVLLPLLPLLAFYAAILLVVFVASLDQPALLNSAQRLQILIVPLAVGAILVEREALSQALDFYVLTATALAVAWSTDTLPASLQFQKNPVGQYIAGGLLVVAAQPGRRRRLVAVPMLAFGLLQTESRGALLGLVAGLAILVVVRPGADKVRTAAILIPFCLLLGLAYANLPDDVQARTTTFASTTAAGAGTSTTGDYTISIRAAYRKDALKIIDEHPYAGVGIGNYLSGNRSDGTLTDDPHNVLLLEAAEGGVPLAAALSLLVLGSAALMWRRRRATPLAALALAVQASTVGHGLVDVYWVRGTPVLGWLLVGAALADAERRREAATGLT